VSCSQSGSCRSSPSFSGWASSASSATSTTSGAFAGFRLLAIPPSSSSAARPSRSSSGVKRSGDAARPSTSTCPPAIDHPRRRYPVFYLLHGFPGRPQGAFLWTNQVGVDEDVLVANHTVHPAILVMPYGSTGFFTDKEWANGIHLGEGWETFMAHDVVRAIDHRYRTIRSGRGRALGGLSEGGYGALNIGLHHPGEFGVLESWSGYVLAENVKSVFGGDHRLLRVNSPLLTLPHAAAKLRRARTYVWLYTGTDDKLKQESAAFAAELRRGRIAYRYNVFRGGHSWALWRAQTPRALALVSRHLAHG
ncbi:MAG: hypothetical protein E6G45_00760, partial [Actinobacteria bacterium]